MELHQADKAYRTRAIWLLAGVSILCAVLLWQLNIWLGRITSELGASDPDTVRYWLRWLLAGLGVALAVPAAALGISLRRLALESRLQGRFPPRTWKTWRDVRVLRDSPAQAWAKRVEVAGVAILCVAGLLVAWAAAAWIRFG